MGRNEYLGTTRFLSNFNVYKREMVMDPIALTYTDGGRIKNLVGFLTYLVYPQSLNKRMYLQQVHRHFDHNDELF